MLPYQRGRQQPTTLTWKLVIIELIALLAVLGVDLIVLAVFVVAVLGRCDGQSF